MHPLKTERELRGWSQAKVAEAVGSTPRNVSRWEQGHPSAALLPRTTLPTLREECQGARFTGRCRGGESRRRGDLPVQRYTIHR